jgi:hypothetical protein
MTMATYEIRLRDHLDAGWSDWFGGLTCTNLPDGGALLSGPVPDQSALFGILAHIRDLNLVLLSVRRIAESEGGSQHGVQEPGR